MKEMFIFVLIAAGVLFGAYFYAPKIQSFFVSPSVAQPEVSVTNTPQSQSNSEVLKKEDVIIGSGAEAKTGDAVAVNYTGTLLDGTKFDSSLDHGKPFEFTLGAGQVIKGWDEGIVGMKVGGKRKLTIPPSLAYGNQSSGPIIKPNSTLVFEVNLIAIKGK